MSVCLLFTHLSAVTAPVLYSVIPAYLPALLRTTITLAGASLGSSTDVPRVTVGGVSCVDVAVDAAGRSLTCVAPMGTGTANVSVETGAGLSFNTLTVTYDCTLFNNTYYCILF